jgi:hypothetical protein
MDIQEYIAELETLVEDSGTEISPKTLERLAKRAGQLEGETDFSEEDILEELLEVLPKKYQDDSDVYDLISSFSEIVLAELENCDMVENEDD